MNKKIRNKSTHNQSEKKLNDTYAKVGIKIPLL